MTVTVNPVKLTTLSVQQWGWVLLAWWTLWRIQARLRWDHSNWLMEKLAQKSSGDADDPTIRLAEQLHESVRIAARLHPWSSDCLPKSLVLHHMLSRRAVAAKLCLGVCKDGTAQHPGIASHAWVEVGSDPICEPAGLRERFRVVQAPEVIATG